MDDGIKTLIGGVNLTNQTATAPTWVDEVAGAYTHPPTVPDGADLLLSQFTVTNKHATVDAILSLCIDDTDTGYKVFCKAAGGGAAIYFPQPIRIPPTKALKFKSSATSDLLVSCVAHLTKG